MTKEWLSKAKQFFYVIRELTDRELKRKYSRSLLGILWSVLNPLLYVLVMSSIFGWLNSNYAAWFAIGYVLWSFFSISTTTSMTAFVDNQNLFLQAKLSRELFVVSRVYTALVNLLMSCLALIVVMIICKITFTFYIFFFFIVVFIEAMFSIGFSFFLATLYVFYKDILFIHKNMLILLIHMVTVYMPIERYPIRVQGITKINPLFLFLDIARKAILDHFVAFDEFMLALVWAVGVLGFGCLFYSINENRMIQRL